MSVLILKNFPAEGPGTIQDFLDARSISYTIVDLQSEPFPDASGFDTLVMLGGPMSVNDADRLPYLAREIRLAADFMREGRRVFGVCLGAQIMAKALGSKIYPGPAKEVGWFDIELTGDGLSDPLMQKLALHPRMGDILKKFKVFHWHGETFDIPRGAERLARSDLYPNQAFRFRNAYAFQFHIEVRREMIMAWLKDEPVDLQLLQCETESFYDVFHSRAMNFYGHFFLGTHALSHATGGDR